MMRAADVHRMGQPLGGGAAFGFGFGGGVLGFFFSAFFSRFGGPDASGFMGAVSPSSS